MAAGTQPAQTLRSWKEIAAYLGRDVRTVIRWERDRGLPVRRPPGNKRAGNVFAYRDELDSWLMDSVTVAAPDHPAPPALAQTSGRRRWNPVPKLAAFVCLWVVVLALSAFGPRIVRRGLVLPLQMVRTDYFPGAGPTGMVLADMDNNGIPDLVIVNSKEESLSVLLGQGNGMFSPAGKVTGLAEYPYYFAVGDFNGDGNLDVAVQTKLGNSRLRIFFGDRAGHLRPGPEQELPGGNKGMAVADLNGDGKLDLVVVLSYAKAVAVLLGNGDGTFHQGAFLLSGVSPGPATIADFNRDGIPDIAVCDYNVGTGNSVTIYLGKGDGTFPSNHSFRTGGGPLHIVAGDVNDDGKLDLVTADFQAGVSLLLGNGDGTFQPPRDFVAGKANTYVALADIDHDGHLDLLSLGEHDDVLAFLRGHGNGNFDPPQKIPTGRYPDVIAVGDFDGDGLLDVAVTNTFANSLSVYLNRSPRRHIWSALVRD